MNIFYKLILNFLHNGTFLLYDINMMNAFINVKRVTITIILTLNS